MFFSKLTTVLVINKIMLFLYYGQWCLKCDPLAFSYALWFCLCTKSPVKPELLVISSEQLFKEVILK